MTARVRIIYVHETTNRARIIEYANREAATPRASSRQFCPDLQTREDLATMSPEFAWETPLPEPITQDIRDFISDSTMELWIGECPFEKRFPDYTGHNNPES